MNELIERFRYRFEVWRRERREDSFWRLGTDLPSRWDTSRTASNTAIEELARRPESLWVVPIRAIGAYLAILVIVGQICRLISFFLPSVRVVMISVFVIFAALWTLMMFTFTRNLYRAKKRLLRTAAQSSNQDAAADA